MSEFEQIIEHIGAFGPYQVRVFLLVSGFETPAAWAMLLPVFAHAKPAWECPSPAGVPWGGAGGAPGTPAGNSTQNGTLIEQCAPDGLICEGATYTSDFTSIVSEWDLVCDKQYISSLITTAQMLGVLLGACITGQLADTFGRRRILYTVYALLQLTSLASSFVTSWQLYTVARFFIGAFFGGTMLVNFVLPMELIGRRWRTFCGCIGFWACGVMSQAGLAFLLRDWRHLSIVCSAAGLPLLITWWWVPESPRWLVQHGRITEAEVLLTEMAQFNKKTVPDFSGLRRCYQKEILKKEESKKYSYWDLFRNINMTRNALIMMYAWFVSSSVYYGTSLNVGHLHGNRYVNFFFSGLVEIPALIFVVLVNNRLGRRKTLTMLMSIAGLSCFAILFVDMAGKLKTMPALTTSLAMLGRAGIAGGWAAAQVYSAEVFPTVVRNIGVGASSMAARIGGIVAPQIVFLNKFSAPLPFLVFGGLALVCAALALLLPETLNQPLPDKLPPRTLCACLSTKQAHHTIEISAEGALVNGTAGDEPAVKVSDNQEVQLQLLNHTTRDKLKDEKT